MLKCSEKAFAMCPTRHLCGTRDEAVFTEFSECAAFNKNVDDKLMTNADRFRMMGNKEFAKNLLDLSRSRLGDFGELYELWCDEKGACVGMTEEEFENFGCPDEHIWLVSSDI